MLGRTFGPPVLFHRASDARLVLDECHAHGAREQFARIDAASHFAAPYLCAIAPSDLELFKFADTPEEAFRILKEQLTENHLESAYEREQQRLERERIPVEPAPSAQEMLGPDITKTR